MAIEIELKLAVPEDALPLVSQHPIIAAAPRLAVEVLDNTYFDTPALTLQAHKMALRLRAEGGQIVQTVKCAAASHGGLAHRPEWEQTYRGVFDFSAIDDVETARLLEKARDELIPVFTARFQRDTRRYQSRPGVDILIMLDTGWIDAGGQRTPVCELELELARGEADDLRQLAAILRRDLPLTPDDRSKAQRGYELFLRR
ncbi:MAG: CYTH domain-containing protein [Azoarcus sp.]|nr:CYTH domain-containing protein [Azoarcus sp.]